MRYVILGTAANIVCSLPIFLLGAMAVQMRSELGFSALALGAAVSLFRLTQAFAATVVGKRVDRYGATRSLRAAIILTQVACAGIAVFAASWLALVSWMGLSAVAKSMAQPAANRLLVNNIPLRRRGTAVGLKQAASPLAAMLAGIAVPVVAVTVGWRWAYVLVAVMGFGVLGYTFRHRPAQPRQNSQRPAKTERLRLRGPLIPLVVAFATGNAASSTIPAFWVDFAVSSGFSVAHAGLLLSLASLAAICARVISGLMCDRIVSGHMFLSSALLATGAIGFGFLSMSTGSGDVRAVAGVILAQGGAWGFSAALWYSALRLYPDSPGQVTGILSVGSLVGSSAGPLLFGFVVEIASYSVAWRAATLLGLLASAAMAVTARSAESERLEQP